MKTSCFSLSAPLIRENFRRFWGLPIVAFLAYFILGIVPILAHYKRSNDLAAFINPLLQQAYLYYTVLSLAVPVVAACLVFRYLHGSSASTMMHALPFTRASLFNSNFLSGLIMSLLPVLATGTILLALAKPVHFGQNISYGEEMGGINEYAILHNLNVFSYGRVFQWIGQTMLTFFCVYAIAVFAGIITGNGIIHLLTAVGFNYLAFAFMSMLIYYFSAFLFGYTTGDTVYELITSLSPYTGLTDGSQNVTPLLVSIYIVCCIALIACASILYHKRKLERAQSAFVFRGMDTAICYMLTFFGMTIGGLLLSPTDDPNWTTYAGLAGGGVAAFIIARMVIKKTFRIFDLSSLKNFIVYTAAAFLFLCVLTFDLTGYTGRVPDASQVEQVTVHDSTLMQGDPRFDPSYYKGTAKSSGEVYKDPENIKGIVALHQSIIDTYKDKKPVTTGGTGFGMRYDKPGGALERSYVVDEDFFANNQIYKKIYESSEFKSMYSAKNLNRLKKGELSVVSSFSYQELIIKKEDRNEFLSCLDKDFQDRIYEEQLDKKRPCGSICLTFKRIVPGMGYEMDGITLNLLDSDTNTLKWLEKFKFIRQLRPNADDVVSIRIYRCDPQDRKKAIEEYGMVDVEDSSYYKQLTVLKDKKYFQEILDTCEAQQDTYICQIKFKDNKTFDDATATYYYGENSAPQFLKDMVK